MNWMTCCIFNMLMFDWHKDWLFWYTTIVCVCVLFIYYIFWSSKENIALQDVFPAWLGFCSWCSFSWQFFINRLHICWWLSSSLCFYSKLLYPQFLRKIMQYPWSETENVCTAPLREVKKCFLAIWRVCEWQIVVFYFPCCPCRFVVLINVHMLSVFKFGSLTPNMRDLFPLLIDHSFRKNSAS
jgi:hypothetical protein